MDEHEDFDDNLDTSQGQRSTMLASTAGQSVVTFAQNAHRQAYNVTKEADAIMHHSDGEEEEMQYPTTSSMAKLEKKTKKAQKKSSLALALIHAELDKHTADESKKVAAMRGPI
jgi:NADH dehydrogenase FAD-containing subunit